MKEGQPNNIELTPTQISRLTTFKNITGRVIEAQANLENGTPLAFGSLNEQGQLANKHFDLDGRFIAVWNDKLSHMYEDELMKNEATKSVADTIVRELNGNRDGTILSPGEMRRLWGEDEDGQ